MKQWIKYAIGGAVTGIVVAGWILYFHNGAVAGIFPKGGWAEKAVKKFGPAPAEVAADDDDDPDTSQNMIPVHVANVTLQTLHQYVEGFGVIAPSAPMPGKMAGSANIASPTAGVVASVNCKIGDKVAAGAALIQLDDRMARAGEEQAEAALAQAEASLAALKAQPKAEQIQIAELGVEKAKAALDFAAKSQERVTRLAADQGASAKALEQAALDWAAAQNDLAVAQKQLDLLKSPPTPEALNQEAAKVGQAKAALAMAQTQLKMMTITAPIDATVAAVMINPGEAVDSTKTLVTLIALDRLTVDVDVPADELPPNAEGLAAEVRVSSKGDGTPVLGKVESVSPEVDPRNGAVTLSIALPADAGLRPGLAVRVRIVAGEHKDCMAVPREAVATNDNGDSVISVVQGDQATHKSVTPGFEENGLVEISPFTVDSQGGKVDEVNAEKVGKGLVVKVVTAGALGLPQSTRVKIVE